MADEYLLRSEVIDALCGARMQDLDVAVKTILHLPAHNVEHIKRGMWIVFKLSDDLQSVICSECLNGYQRSAMLPLPVYCETCGAKMDKERKTT